MNKFLSKTLFLFILCLVANFIFYDTVFHPVLYEKYEANLRPEHFQSYNKIILGDSHAAAIPQAYFDSLNTLNLSYDGDSYFDMHIKLKKSIDTGATIDTVFISADNHTLSKYPGIAKQSQTEYCN